MSELVPLTNAVAAMMIRSALSRCGGEDGILAGALTSVPTAADAAAVAAAASPANDPSREHPPARWLLAAV